MSKLALYLERVSQEDAELEQEEVVEQTPEEIAVQEVIVENELEVPEVSEEPITEEEMDEVEDAAEVATDEISDVADEVEETTEMAEQVHEEVASIEEHIQVLSHGLKTKTYSPQFVALAQSKLDKLAGVFGETSTVSIENYDGENLEAYYQVSVEAFEGFLKRLSDVLHNGGVRMADKINKAMAVEGYAKVAKKQIARADAILKAEAKDEPATIKGKQAAKQFHIGGEFDGNIVAALASDMKFINSQGMKLIKANNQYMSGLMDIIDRAVKDGGVGKTGDILAEALKLSRPVDVLSEEAFKGALAGGLHFVKGKTKAKDEDDKRAGYKDIGRAAIPGVGKVGFKGEAEEVTIDKASADKIATTAKATVALALKVVEGEALKSLETFYRRLDVSSRPKGANATSWGENKDLNILARQLIDMGHAQFHVYYEVLDNLMKNVDNALSQAEKAVVKTVSNEDADLTVSNEGWLGAVAGFIGTGVVSSLIPFAGGAAIGAGAKAQMQKYQQDIETISERIAKIRNGQIDEATKKGLQLPKSIKRVDGIDVAKGAVWGTLFGPIYGAVKGSEIENEYKKLQSKLDELEKAMKQAGIEPEGKKG